MLWIPVSPVHNHLPGILGQTLTTEFLQEATSQDGSDSPGVCKLTACTGGFP